MTLGHFVDVCRKKDLKVKSHKSKVMLIGGEAGLECEICVDGVRIEQVSELKYLGLMRYR